MLLLVPAGIFAVLVLASIAVDTAQAHLVRNDLELAAAAAANDAVAAALDEEALRAGRGYVLNPDRVRQVVSASLQASDVYEDLVEQPNIDIDPGGEVRVELAADVDPVFGAALPGGRRATTVRAVATAASAQR